MDNNGQRMSNANSNPGLYVQDVYADPDSITSNDTQSVSMQPYANAGQTANNITYAAQETQDTGAEQRPIRLRCSALYGSTRISVDPVLLDFYNGQRPDLDHVNVGSLRGERAQAVSDILGLMWRDITVEFTNDSRLPIQEMNTTPA